MEVIGTTRIGKAGANSPLSCCIEGCDSQCGGPGPTNVSYNQSYPNYHYVNDYSL